jgi:hypothetical protein
MNHRKSFIGPNRYFVIPYASRTPGGGLNVFFRTELSLIIITLNTTRATRSLQEIQP